MKKILGILIIFLGWGLGAYAGIWLMFIKPIIECCIAFDGGTLTGLMIGTTIIKLIFAGTVFSILAYLGTMVGNLMIKKAWFEGKR